VSKGTLETRVRYFVEVCRFTFSFATLEEVKRYLEFFRLKVRPSTPWNIRDGMDAWLRERALERGHPVGELARTYRTTRYNFRRAERYYVQTPFERLPMYLLETKNRLRVVKALEAALGAWS
jgi:hypothetical protein